MFLPALLVYYGVLSLSANAVRLLAIGGLLGPVLSGFIMTAIIEGKPGITSLTRRIVRWRVGLQWYVFAIIGLPALMLFTTLIRPGALESLDISGQPSVLSYLRAFISMALIGGPLFEEPGWTGFAQPRLQRSYGPLAGGFILGSLWAVWHLPGFLIPSQDLSDIPPRGTCARLRIVRPGPYWFAPNYHVGRQQYKKQRIDGHFGPCVVEHVLCGVPGSGLSRASRARELFEPHAGRIRPGAAAYRGNGRANWLPVIDHHGALSNQDRVCAV